MINIHWSADIFLLSLWKGCFRTISTTSPTIHLTRIHYFFPLMAISFSWRCYQLSSIAICNPFNQHKISKTIRKVLDFHRYVQLIGWIRFSSKMYCCQQKINCVLSTTCCCDDKHLLKYSRGRFCECIFPEKKSFYKFLDNKSKNDEFQIIDLCCWFFSFVLSSCEWGDPKKSSLPSSEAVTLVFFPTSIKML